MKLLRSIAAVLFGYMLFAMATLTFFKVSGIAPHGNTSITNMMISVAVGIIAALSGGYAAARLAGREPFVHGVAVAALLALGAIVSLVKTMGHGSLWSQVAALALMVPSAAFGGLLRAKQQ